MSNQSAFEHNAILLPAWFTEINKQDAKAAVIFCYKQGGEGFMLNAPSLTKQNVIDLLKSTLEHLENGQGLIQLLN